MPVRAIDSEIAALGNLQNESAATLVGIISTFDENTLAPLKRPWGSGTQKVGKRAGGILTMARAMERGEAILLQPPDIPEVPNYVMFDLEGMPPYLDEVDKIYLWGTQVFGDKPSEYRHTSPGGTFLHRHTGRLLRRR